MQVGVVIASVLIGGIYHKSLSEKESRVFPARVIAK